MADNSGNYLNPAIANAMARSQLPTQEEREKAMHQAMADVVKYDRNINPHEGNPAFERTMSDLAGGSRGGGRGNGWYDPGPLGVAAGEQTQRLIEAMCNAELPMVREIGREEVLRLMAEVEKTRPDSPVLARAKAALAAEEKAKARGEK
jgi:hypothetical protein